MVVYPFIFVKTPKFILERFFSCLHEICSMLQFLDYPMKFVSTDVMQVVHILQQLCCDPKYNVFFRHDLTFKTSYLLIRNVRKNKNSCFQRSSEILIKGLRVMTHCFQFHVGVM